MNKSFESPDNTDFEWEERLAAMANALPRECEPGRLLEERTVAVLRKRGMLKPRRRSRRLQPGWLAGAVAASVMLFAFGVVVGQWLGTRTATRTVIALQQNDAQRTAAQVQAAGSAYVDALQALAQLSDSTRTEVSAQGREVALTALHAAANEVVRLAPNDPIAAEILRGFQRVKDQQAAQRPQQQRQVIWF
jgi:hypothetical protein